LSEKNSPLPLQKQIKYQNELMFDALKKQEYHALFSQGNDQIRILQDTKDYSFQLVFNKDSIPLFELKDTNSTAYRYIGRYFWKKEGDWIVPPYIISYSLFKTKKGKKFLLVSFGSTSGEGSDIPMDQNTIDYLNRTFQPEFNAKINLEPGLSHQINFELLFYL
jgi:hypothetical protein